MSHKEGLRCLAEFAEKDRDFAENFMAAAKAKNVDEAIRLAAEKGVTLSAEDFAFDGKRELDLEELDHVTGGYCREGATQFFCYLLLFAELWNPANFV